MFINPISSVSSYNNFQKVNNNSCPSFNARPLVKPQVKGEVPSKILNKILQYFNLVITPGAKMAKPLLMKLDGKYDVFSGELEKHEIGFIVDKSDENKQRLILKTDVKDVEDWDQCGKGYVLDALFDKNGQMVSATQSTPFDCDIFTSTRGQRRITSGDGVYMPSKQSDDGWMPVVSPERSKIPYAESRHHYSKLFLDKDLDSISSIFWALAKDRTSVYGK